MNARNKVLNHLESMKEVDSIRVMGEVPLVDGRYMVQVLVYLKPEQRNESLGVEASETIKSKDQMR